VTSESIIPLRRGDSPTTTQIIAWLLGLNLFVAVLSVFVLKVRPS